MSAIFNLSDRRQRHGLDLQTAPAPSLAPRRGACPGPAEPGPRQGHRRGAFFASGHGGAGGNGDGPPLPRHELFSIVVASDQRRRGVAERLYRRLCAGFRDRGLRPSASSSESNSTPPTASTTEWVRGPSPRFSCTRAQFPRSMCKI
ncbi:GNAT family N-acetyltransferase [Jhaorihella thermophila]